MSDGLAALLRTKKQLYDAKEAKISDINEQWPVEIKSFYERIEDWLSDLIEEKIILPSYEIKRSGSYYSKSFKLKVGYDEIEFIPNKRVVVGSTGKVQMKTKKGNISFVRDRDGIWKQVVSKSPFSVEIVTKRKFRCLLKSVLS